MKIKLVSIMVEHQQKALEFYTNVLGFVKKMDFPVGVQDYRWITVVSPEGPDDIELALEPNGNPIGKTFQQGLHDSGIAATAFAVDNLQAEYERLKGLGVVFTMPPTSMGSTYMMAVFDDTCGNLIQIYQG